VYIVTSFLENVDKLDYGDFAPAYFLQIHLHICPFITHVYFVFSLRYIESITYLTPYLLSIYLLSLFVYHHFDLFPCRCLKFLSDTLTQCAVYRTISSRLTAAVDGTMRSCYSPFYRQKRRKLNNRYEKRQNYFIRHNLFTPFIHLNEIIPQFCHRRCYFVIILEDDDGNGFPGLRRKLNFSPTGHLPYFLQFVFGLDSNWNSPSSNPDFLPLNRVVEFDMELRSRLKL
jgi:hypothetical protein